MKGVGGLSETREGDKEVQTSSYGINNSQGYGVQHGEYGQ